MFDFEKLEVYRRAKGFNAEISVFRSRNNIDRVPKDQLKRASLSVALNIAEGSSRFTKPDRKNFLIIARGSLFECVVILEILKEQELMTAEDYNKFYKAGDELSRMIFAMIKNLQLSGSESTDLLPISGSLKSRIIRLLD
ncbi:MAG: four helix bundle protein [Flavobacteriales bacterium]|nr:four helix bundle protein [Flavobacteriales bacterium]